MGRKINIVKMFQIIFTLRLYFNGILQDQTSANAFVPFAGSGFRLDGKKPKTLSTSSQQEGPSTSSAAQMAGKKVLLSCFFFTHMLIITICAFLT